MNSELKLAQEAAIEAGALILDYYKAEYEIKDKGYHNPVTTADYAADTHLKEVLTKARPDYGWLSEETVDSSDRLDKDRVWVVDPLDGTKEFVKRNGEFTVNIALIEEGVPVMGVIYVPVKKVLYFASDQGAYKKVGDQIERLPNNKKKKNFVAVGSRSHMSDETKAYFDRLKVAHGEIDVVSMGSSLKICLVAEGVADVYPRFAPTMEWDTAAGQAIVKYAGKTLIDYNTKKEMLYNRHELRNNWFIVQ